MDSVSWLKGWKSFDWTNLDTVFEGLSSFWKKTVFVFKSKFLSRLQLWRIYGILLKKKTLNKLYFYYEHKCVTFYFINLISCVFQVFSV